MLGLKWYTKHPKNGPCPRSLGQEDLDSENNSVNKQLYSPIQSMKEFLANSV